MSSAECFDMMGYTRIDGFLDESTVSIISYYMENKIRRGEWTAGSHGDPISCYSYYADPLIEVLLLKCKDVVGQATGKELLPTYSYSKIYQPGEQLKKHVDRKSCEISVTVNIATKGEISPFYVKYKDNKITEHKLNPGDAIVYKGCEVDHWREPLKEGQINVQFMLHYVDKNGPYKAFEKDKRPLIGLSCNTAERI